MLLLIALALALTMGGCATKRSTANPAPTMESVELPDSELARDSVDLLNKLLAFIAAYGGCDRWFTACEPESGHVDYAAYMKASKAAEKAFKLQQKKE